ncbi:MAG: signal peptidase I [Clostridia bacterium]|nr:signal peptidase I [Clostridia bacterium]
MLDRCKNRIFPVVSKLAFLALIIIGLIVGFYLIKEFDPNKILSLNDYRMYVVKSGSMSPTIRVGSLILVKGVHYNNIKEGDIITYSGKSSEAVTHRVVGIENHTGISFTTKGDANDTPDPLQVESNRLLGKVVFCIPYIGRIFDFLKTKIGFVALTIIMLAIIVLPDLFIKFRNIKK